MPQQAPPDDSTIGEGEFVYRRVRGDQIVLLDDGSGYRPSSAVISSKGGPLSGDLSSLCTPQQTRGSEICHVVAIPVSALRAENCHIHRAPQPGNPAHVHVWGTRLDGAIGKAAGRIAMRSRVVLVHPDIPLPDGSQH